MILLKGSVGASLPISFPLQRLTLVLGPFWVGDELCSVPSVTSTLLNELITADIRSNCYCSLSNKPFYSLKECNLGLFFNAWWETREIFLIVKGRTTFLKYKDNIIFLVRKITWYLYVQLKPWTTPGLGEPTPCTVKNSRITFDSSQT